MFSEEKEIRTDTHTHSEKAWGGEACGSGRKIFILRLPLVDYIIG